MPTKQQLGLCLFLACSYGCGGHYAAVEGTVTLDGQPLTKATLVFNLQDKPKFKRGPSEAVAFSDENGRFRLRTSNDEGAVPGKYKVTVSKPEAGKGRDAGRLIETLPAVYTKEKSTPFEVDVPSGGKRDVLLTLDSKF